MLKLWIYFLFLITFGGQPVFAQNQLLSKNISFAFNSKKFLGLQNGLRSFDKGMSKLNIKYDMGNTVSQLAFSYDGHNNFILDGSYLQYTSDILTFGVGSIDRHWSFSDNTSLILSKNARPIKSIYLKLENRFNHYLLPSEASWSFETFNGFTEGSLNNSSSMILGARATLTPILGLDFELIQTSQWGGKGQSTGISALGSALFLDSNAGSNSNINKMAGFGISYTFPTKLMPLRIYGQAIGEDEAGNLPSCFAYLAGIEWKNIKIKYPTTVGIEAVDTRINRTTHGYCGPNTFYNNNTYDYTNYGDTMGATVDTEGKSLEFFGKSQISQNIDIKYSTKLVTINDKNWVNHRLSLKRQSGLINSLGFSWVKNNITFNGDIYSQNLSLKKANINSGYGVNFSSSIKF